MNAFRSILLTARCVIAGSRWLRRSPVSSYRCFCRGGAATVLSRVRPSGTARRYQPAAERLDLARERCGRKEARYDPQGQSEVASWSTYVGRGAIRFYLPLNVQLNNDFFAQAVVVAKR